MTTTLAALQDWVDSVATLTRPDTIQWCDGGEDEYQRLIEDMTGTGTLLPLDQAEYPDCYLHRSDPSDVARVEHLTFVCPSNEEDAGPNNNWIDPAQAHEKIDALFAGCMQGGRCTSFPIAWDPSIHRTLDSGSRSQTVRMSWST